ncbi:RNA-directed DNA polymerase, eukaryota [Tanacetum coccineum]
MCKDWSTLLMLKNKVQHARENRPNPIIKSLLALAKQKALVPRLVKEGPGKMNLAIGDGAYDVGMIHEANIGVGISDIEGTQSQLSRAPTIIFRMDVSHGSHGRSDVPSIAAVQPCKDNRGNNWRIVGLLRKKKRYNRGEEVVTGKALGWGWRPSTHNRDINVVSSNDDILNTQVNIKETNEFINFINERRLAEIPMGGRKFTRVSNDGMKFSMLGRLLLNDDFNNTWGNFSVIALDMKLLDHYIGTESFTFEYLVFLEQFWKRHEKQSILEQKRRKMHSDQRKDTKYAHLAIRRIKLLPNMSNKSPYSRVDAVSPFMDMVYRCPNRKFILMY